MKTNLTPNGKGTEYAISMMAGNAACEYANMKMVERSTAYGTDTHAKFYDISIHRERFQTSVLCIKFLVEENICQIEDYVTTMAREKLGI